GGSLTSTDRRARGRCAPAGQLLVATVPRSRGTRTRRRDECGTGRAGVPPGDRSLRRRRRRAPRGTGGGVPVRPAAGGRRTRRPRRAPPEGRVRGRRDPPPRQG